MSLLHNSAWSALVSLLIILVLLIRQGGMCLNSFENYGAGNSFKANNVVNVQITNLTNQGRQGSSSTPRTSSPEKTTSIVWSTIPKKSGYGFIYSSYSSDTNKSLPRYLEEAATSARELKQRNPTIATAIITNAKQVPDIFDHVVRVSDALLFPGLKTRPDGISRQWFTRLYYLAHSPF
mmetsp:Transcript_6514/g.10785  ORF Transcript_6514/g.10785 Transcript_6514/m.10785 type:complete len:179 (-) Transcript_6514:695-1231(-)